MRAAGPVAATGAAGAAGTAAMDLVEYRRYRRGGGTESLIAWQTAKGVSKWDYDLGTWAKDFDTHLAYGAMTAGQLRGDRPAAQEFTRMTRRERTRPCHS
jgi:hypothetical protein